MSSNEDFLPSSSPISSICAIEIEAILFLFMMNCYKSSFQECITMFVLKIERTRNQPPYCLLQLREKMTFLLPGRVVLGLPSPSPRVCTGGRTYADVRTKIFRINGLPNLLTHGAPRAPLWCFKISSQFINAHIFPPTDSNNSSWIAIACYTVCYAKCIHHKSRVGNICRFSAWLFFKAVNWE